MLNIKKQTHLHRLYPEVYTQEHLWLLCRIFWKPTILNIKKQTHLHRLYPEVYTQEHLWLLCRVPGINTRALMHYVDSISSSTQSFGLEQSQEFPYVGFKTLLSY